MTTIILNINYSRILNKRQYEAELGYNHWCDKHIHIELSCIYTKSKNLILKCKHFQYNMMMIQQSMLIHTQFANFFLVYVKLRLHSHQRLFQWCSSSQQVHHIQYFVGLPLKYDFLAVQFRLLIKSRIAVVIMVTLSFQ